MRYLFFVNTPGQAHTWHPVIRLLEGKGHESRVIARDYQNTLALLDGFGIRYTAVKNIRRKRLKYLEFPYHVAAGVASRRTFAADVYAGFGMDAAMVACLTRKKGFVFDDDCLPVQRDIYRWAGAHIVTPLSVGVDLGVRHVRVPSYKELSYLHPSRFTPDASVLRELGVGESAKYVIVRLNAFNALHDVGRHGFSQEDRHNLVELLSSRARVFISSEGRLPPELDAYRLAIPHDRIHHALAFASLVVSDTQTVSIEAAVLGVPTVRCNSWVGPDELPSFVELEKEYGLLYSFSDAKEAIAKAVGLVSDPEARATWAQRRRVMLQDKEDLAVRLTDMLEDLGRGIWNVR